MKNAQFIKQCHKYLFEIVANRQRFIYSSFEIVEEKKKKGAKVKEF